QYRGGLDVAGSRDRHQRGLPFGVRRVGVGTGFEQQLQHVGVGNFGGERHRRRAVVVGERDIGARTQQTSDFDNVAVVDGPLQGRAAIRIAAIHIRARSGRRGARRSFSGGGRSLGGGGRPCLRCLRVRR